MTTPGPSLKKGGEPCPASALTGKKFVSFDFSSNRSILLIIQPVVRVPLLAERLQLGQIYEKTKKVVSETLTTARKLPQ